MRVCSRFVAPALSAEYWRKSCVHIMKMYLKCRGRGRWVTQEGTLEQEEALERRCPGRSYSTDVLDHLCGICVAFIPRAVLS